MNSCESIGSVVVADAIVADTQSKVYTQRVNNNNNNNYRLKHN